MNNFDITKHITVITLCIIILIQIVWIYSMYSAYKKDLDYTAVESLRNATIKELAEREDNMVGPSLSPLGARALGDTSRFVYRDFVTVDTTYHVKIDRYDSYSIAKVKQYMLKDKHPLDLKKIYAIFRLNLKHSKLAVEKSRIEYLNIKTKSIIDSCGNSDTTVGILSFSISHELNVDITDDVIIKMHTVSPVSAIFQLMSLQLALSFLLIAVILYLIRTIIVQRKEEKMRQDSINAMTHEFKRPISSAVAQTALIPYYLGKNNSSKASKYAENTLLELNKLTAYTERIQQISNDNVKNVFFDKVDVEVKPFFEQIINKYSALKAKPINISLFINTEIEFIKVDMLHFSNVIDNLVENAIKYSREKIEIIITVSHLNTDLVVSVKDSGIGISKSDKKRIFKKFYRSTNIETMKQFGFGLGLTYVKSIVEGHAGKINVISERYNGSEFIIQIPIGQQIDEK